MPGAGSGKERQPLRIEPGPQVAAPLPEVVRPHYGLDEREVAAKQPVLVEALDDVDSPPDLLDEPFGDGRVMSLRMQARLEELDEHPREAGVAHERLPEVAVAEGRPRLTPEVDCGAQDRDLATGQPGARHQPVQAVVLEPPAPHPEERVREPLHLDARTP